MIGVDRVWDLTRNVAENLLHCFPAGSACPSEAPITLRYSTLCLAILDSLAAECTNVNGCAYTGLASRAEQCSAAGLGACETSHHHHNTAPAWNTLMLRLLRHPQLNSKLNSK